MAHAHPQLPRMAHTLQARERLSRAGSALTGLAGMVGLVCVPTLCAVRATAPASPAPLWVGATLALWFSGCAGAAVKLRDGRAAATAGGLATLATCWIAACARDDGRKEAYRALIAAAPVSRPADSSLPSGGSDHLCVPLLLRATRLRTASGPPRGTRLGGGADTRRRARRGARARVRGARRVSRRAAPARGALRGGAQPCADRRGAAVERKPKKKAVGVVTGTSCHPRATATAGRPATALGASTRPGRSGHWLLRIP